jgi:hypothetical protein
MTRWIHLTLVPVALLASSCALLRTPDPVVQTVTQTVDKPVKVACLEPGQKPTKPKRITEAQPVPPETLTEMVGQLRAKITELFAYADTADELLTICSELPYPEAPTSSASPQH